MNQQEKPPLDLSRCLVIATIGDREPDILSIRHPDRKFRLEIVDHGQKERGIGAYQWQGSNKYVRFFEMFGSEILKIDDYDYFWFPDDDIADATHEDVERLFKIAHENDLRLFQPSLSELSQNIGWPAATKHLPGSVFRYTNFVEAMMPAFRQDALKICLPTFNQNPTAYGHDFVWAKLVGWKGMGVIDSVVVRHMHSSPAGPGTWQGMHEILAKYGLNYSVVSRNVQSF